MSYALDSRTKALEEAFALFTDTSSRLAASYDELERRVADLTGQLAAANDARLNELTAKERLAEHVQALLEALPGGVVVLDREGIVRECNAGARELLGDPMLGLAWTCVAARAFSGNDASELRLVDGRRLSIAFRELFDGGTVQLFTDVTEARELQDRLARYQRLSAMGEMTARLAHQLRTPLAAAVLYISHLAEGDVEFATTARLSGKALSCLKHLERLVDDMLAYTRGDMTGMQRVSVAALLDEVAQSIEPQLVTGGRVSFNGEPDSGVVQGQREVLIGALLNLITNALQVTAGKGHVRVTTASNAGWVEFSVSDDGPGVAPEIGERIFEPFFSLRSGGTGLGLAIVRSVVEAHGGSITLHSLPGSGATFLVRLPQATGHHALPSGSAGWRASRADLTEYQS